MTKVLYTGSFDPITNGHTNIIKQASELFDEVIVAVLINSSKKNPMFTIEERIKMIEELYRNQNNIKVVSGIVAVDIALLYGCKAIIRGIRNSKDFDDEFQMSQINRQLSNNNINTVCLFTDPSCQFISSSMVKEIFNLGKDISGYVDPIVRDKMLSKKRSASDGNI
jgi:pantetheine-phosphate adenylyltransferase